MKSRFDPEDLLPLSGVHFEILVCLADGERHGYAIKREIGERTDHDPSYLQRRVARA
jgi:DNA-binding PadR family transcriptional regulator